MSNCCNCMDYSSPSSFVRGISQARTMESVAISFSRRSYPPNPGLELRTPAFQADSLPKVFFLFILLWVCCFVDKSANIISKLLKNVWINYSNNFYVPIFLSPFFFPFNSHRHSPLCFLLGSFTWPIFKF